MVVLPSLQFHMDSLQSSFSKFNGTRINFFFRYNSSFSMKSQAFNSNSMINKDPQRKSSLVAANRGISEDKTHWVTKWNEPNRDNRPKPPRPVMDYRDVGGGGSSGSTMERIVEKLKKFGYVDSDSGSEKEDKDSERVIEKGSVEDIFYVEEGMLPNPRGGFSKDSPLGVEDVFKSDGQVRFPWEKPKKNEIEEGKKGQWSARSKSRTFLAELTLPESELRRLTNLTYQVKSKVKVGGAGITQEVVDTIHEKWKTCEIARVKVNGAPALNMKRIHEILERKTGGLVIWRSGTSVSIYRGVTYDVPAVQLNKLKKNEISTTSLAKTSSKYALDAPKGVSSDEVRQSNSSADTDVNNREEGAAEVNYEKEVDKLLDGLGPRYKDWTGLDPLPVDADMLPGIIPGYEPPFRVLPYGVRSTLGQKEATSLRRLSRVLPPHFALGRSRQLQGLATAMIKLWEKSSIAKIALKRGVQLTTSERMAEELKKLTGGILLSRNKDFMVFYRGKNFLSPDVTKALLERERLAKSLQDEEEQARLRASTLTIPTTEVPEPSGTAGTLDETLDADAKWGRRLDDDHEEKIKRELESMRHASIIRKLERKLASAERRLVKAEQARAKVEGFLKPAERNADPESITEEERFMFRKLGLRMKAFLLLGRRGVFDGTVENMHLHWKYRELIKIIVKAKTFERVKKIALALEAESGGVLVSVDKVSKGYAIIVYRGKDYQRPSSIRPKNLLTKRRALARSIEIQRSESLLNHISHLQKKVDQIRSEIGQMELVKNRGDEQLYDRLDSAYPTDDDESEEGDESLYQTYNSEDGSDHDDECSTYNAVQNSSQNQQSKTGEQVSNGRLEMHGSLEDDEDDNDYDSLEEGDDDYDSLEDNNELEDDGFDGMNLALDSQSSFPYA